MKKLSTKQQTNRILKWYNLATPEEINNGLNWYAEARYFCASTAELFTCTIEQVAQITSLLSPQQSWSKNKENVVKFLSGIRKGIFATKKQFAECENVMNDSFRIPENRLKTFAFADNIANSTSEKITIDRHAIKIAYDQITAKPIGITTKRYSIAERAYNEASNILGIKGYQLQAITWVTYKRVVGR